MIQKRVAIIGGDNRNIYLSSILIDKGFEVYTFALNSKDSQNIEDIINEVDLIIGPIPFSINGKTLNTPFYQKHIYIDDFFKLINNKPILIAGKLDKIILEQGKDRFSNIIDLSKREDFSILNAILTSEGAIQIALQETFSTINSSNILIIGYGRIGKILNHMLKGFNPCLKIMSILPEEKAYGLAFGANHIDIKELKQCIKEFDIIFNTAPALVLDIDLLLELKKRCSNN